MAGASVTVTFAGPPAPNATVRRDACGANLVYDLLDAGTGAVVATLGTAVSPIAYQDSVSACYRGGNAIWDVTVSLAVPAALGQSLPPGGTRTLWLRVTRTLFFCPASSQWCTFIDGCVRGPSRKPEEAACSCSYGGSSAAAQSAAAGSLFCLLFS